VDDDFEMIAVEVKGMDRKYMWEITVIYRAPNQDMLAIEILATRNLATQNLMKRSIMASSLNSYYASLFSCEHNNPQIQSAESGKPFTISVNIIRK